MISARSIALQGLGATVAVLVAVQGLAPTAVTPPAPTGVGVYGVNTYWSPKGGGALPLNPIRHEEITVRRKATPKPLEMIAEPPQERRPVKPPERVPVAANDNDDEEVLAIIEAWLKVK